MCKTMRDMNAWVVIARGNKFVGEIMFQSFKGLASHCVFDIWYVLQHMDAFCTHSMASLVLPEFLCKSKEVENA